MFRPWCTFGFLPLLMGVLATLSTPASADDRVTRLSQELAKATDFRVRTQAALALGATGNKRAVRPLCQALNDASVAVRAASAAALGKLLLGGKHCLSERLETEPSSSVKIVIKKTLARLAGDDGEPPALTGATTYYLAIEVTDATGRSGNEVERLIRAGMAQAALSSPKVALISANQTPQAVAKTLAEHPAVRGFILSAQVEKPKYSGKSLAVHVHMAILTYPEKNLRGSIPVSLTRQAVEARDQAAEDELIQTAAVRCLERFLQNAERIR